MLKFSVITSVSPKTIKNFDCAIHFRNALVGGWVKRVAYTSVKGEGFWCYLLMIKLSAMGYSHV